MICAIAAAGLRPFGHVRAPRQGYRGVSRAMMKMRGAKTRTVKDCVTTIETHLVLKFLLTVSIVGITRVGNPTVSLHESGGAEIFVLVPPVGRTGGGTAGTKDAFIETIEFLAVLLGLKELAVGRGIVILKVGLDGLVLLVEQSEVRDEVFHNVH